MINFPEPSSSSGSVDSAGISTLPSSGYYRVKSGDTLFSIAFRYGIDYRELADLNHIKAPYTIFPRQKIWLKERNSTKADSSTTTARANKIASNDVKESTKKTRTVNKVNLPEKTVSNSTQLSQKVSSWRWPVTGKVVRGFSNNGVSSKGIDIKGEEGELVKAVADGTVVYAGSGLIGYGNLVIVKHNDIYLSAYAYNERILVKEKQNVQAGDSLAVIGGKGNERPLLHFEIRRDGQPIDPLKILPEQ